MVRCENCVLLEAIINPDGESKVRCALLNIVDLNISEERKCIDFQPGP